MYGFRQKGKTMKLSYKSTIAGCFIAHAVQAIIINFTPLLFVFFQDTYQIPLSQITLLLTVGFFVQLTTDIVWAKIADRMGYRTSMVIAHFAAAAGLLALTILPEVMMPFAGMLISVSVYSVGAGIIEVLINPIMESCPTDNKEKAMSLLHSFYCWGVVCAVLISTVFFRLAGIQNWRIMACIWAALPLFNGVLFMKAPIAPLIAPGEKGMTLGQLIKDKTFWILVIMIICAGASENGVVLWSSAFAERGLHIDKTLGDLAGPMAFAVVMGLTRIIHSKIGDKLNLDNLMLGSTVLCVIAYLMITLVPSPIVNLIGCGVCGVSVALLWPGTVSKAAAAMRNGGTILFAMLALAGDIGCSAGPTLVGMVSDAANDNMKIGILAGLIFPVTMLLCMLFWKKKQKKSKE